MWRQFHSDAFCLLLRQFLHDQVFARSRRWSFHHQFLEDQHVTRISPRKLAALDCILRQTWAGYQLQGHAVIDPTSLGSVCRCWISSELYPCLGRWFECPRYEGPDPFASRRDIERKLHDYPVYKSPNYERCKHQDPRQERLPPIRISQRVPAIRPQPKHLPVQIRDIRHSPRANSTERYKFLWWLFSNC